MRTSNLPWLLVLGLLAALMLMRGMVSQRSARLELAEDSLAILEPLVRAQQAEALKRDTILVTVTDTIRVTIERTRLVAAAATDSVVAHVDTVGARWLDSLNAAHHDEVAAMKELADERLRWGTAWRDVARALEAQNEQHQTINDELRRAIGRSRRNANIYKASIVLGGLAIAVNALR